MGDVLLTVEPDLDHREHIEVAKAWIRKHSLDDEYQTIEPEVVHGSVVEFGQSGTHQLIVTTMLVYGDRELDQIAVIGMYIDHDGQLTTAINHLDGCIILDNADEMFGKKD